MDPLAAFRRALRPREDVVMAPAVVEPPKTRNSKRALKNWRIVLDKVVAAQFLVGSEESVQSWLQAEVISEGSPQPSCVLLAEEIKGAERMPSLKSKMVAPVMDEAGCRHPANRLQRGGNQYTGWVTCMDCFARWKVPRLPKKEKTSSKKDVASRMAQLALESPARSSKDNFNPAKFMKEVEEKMRTELKKSETAEQRNVGQTARKLRTEEVETRRLTEELRLAQIQYQHLTKTHQSEIQEAKSLLNDSKKTMRMQEMMMSEYATMAMGGKYLEQKGYLDGEMWNWAEQRLLQEEDLEMLNIAQKENEKYMEEMEEARRAEASASRAHRVKKKDKSVSPSPATRR